MEPAQALDIAAVVRHARLPASTLRYYEDIGLIKSVGRRGLRRIFNASVLDQLAFISLGRTAGFTLQEISQAATADGAFKIDRNMISEKADALDQKIKRLKAISTFMRHVAECPAEDQFTCPKFQRLLRSAKRRR